MLATSAIVYGEEDTSSFKIQPIEPYSVPETSNAVISLSANELANLAARNCGPANLILREYSSNVDTLCRKQLDQTTVREVRQSTAHRFRENTATLALKMHYGLAACKQSQELLNRTRVELDRQMAAQRKLIDEGVPIPDPLLLDRLMQDLNDQVLENESKQKTLRIQLSELIGSQAACNYDPSFDRIVQPSDIDVCDHIQTAMCRRQELALLYRLRTTLNESTIDAWETIAGLLSGIPILQPRNASLSTKIKRLFLRDEIDKAVKDRRVWLETLIQERTNNIRKDVEIAYEAKRVAALRWANAMEQRTTWGTRILQLEKIGEELKGNLAEQSAARIQSLQSEGAIIKRWLDWHLANVDLANATGTVLSPPQGSEIR